jgi:glycosyltransferase involved in cell wall biosynthesis
LPFQNQSRMPIVYRLGDVFVLPSLYGETWGLAVNEALASNRPVLASNRVGCAADVITPECGFVFDPYDAMALTRALDEVVASRKKLSSLSAAAGRRAGLFDIGITAQATVSCLEKVVSL